MRIAAVNHELPKTVVQNKDVLEKIEAASLECFEGDLERTLKLIGALLRKTAVRERRLLTLDESPFDYIKAAVQRSLDQAEMRAEDIDMVIHSSVDRRVLEPGMSFFIANGLGMHKAQCFDVLEACASWTRAASIAQGYLKSGMAKNILIVTAEFGLHEGEWGQNTYRLTCDADLEYAYASYTLGESTTATILTAEGDDWVFRNETANNLSELCVMPIDLTREENWLYGDVSLMGEGPKKFACRAIQMAESGMPMGQRMFIDPYRDAFRNKEIDIVFPHSHTYHAWKDSAQANEMDIPYYFTFPKTGNLITGSIPSGMSMAIEDGTLVRGNRCAAWMAAAGLTFTSIDFDY